jgi:hypothetical protein
VFGIIIHMPIFLRHLVASRSTSMFKGYAYHYAEIDFDWLWVLQVSRGVGMPICSLHS